MEYIINSKEAEKTVKEILTHSLGLSMALIKHLKFVENGILLNGSHATVRRVVQAGDILTLATEDTHDGSRLTPCDIPLDIIFEDSEIVIPNKPPFMPTHPSHLHHGDTLADALAFRYQRNNSPFVFRPVNRLDKNTSGLTIVAKNRISAAKMADAMKNGQIKKIYIAVLCGELPLGEGTIETHIRRTAQSIIVRENCAEDDGDYALTRYKVLKSENGYSLVLAAPKTGRTHQLRVHFSGLGAPIVGDELYGVPSKQIERHALHAAHLLFLHPNDKKTISLYAPMPSDMRALCDTVFGENAVMPCDLDFNFNIDF